MSTEPPTSPPAAGLANGIDGLAAWRLAALAGIKSLNASVIERGLATSAAREVLQQLMQRLSSDKVVLAFVGEFSRGKSELINAIFFGDSGARMLPASPGRTTMCPLELAYDPALPQGLSLLPIATRLEAATLAELRLDRSAWVHRPLAAEQPALWVDELQEVTRTEWVTKAQAEALGFWHDDEAPDDRPPCDEHGRVQIPAWRHAALNMPHPLLGKGLVVIDTPGLNAIGSEPELTLNLLPSAHATVFVVGADTGVTRSDLSLWRDHLAEHTACRFVALNKIDTLADPLATAEQIAAQIESQRLGVAQTLLHSARQVFPLSARQALAARIAGDADALAESGLLALERALSRELVSARRDVLVQSMSAALDRLGDLVSRKVGDERASVAEQRTELEAVRGKSAARVARMDERITVEVTDFDRCSARLKALRSVQQRIDGELRGVLSAARLSDEVARLQSAMAEAVIGRAAKREFAALCDRSRGALARAEALAGETRLGMTTAYQQLNAEFGLALVTDPAVDFSACRAELDAIEANYARYFGLAQRLRAARSEFQRKFTRMLGAKLQVLFESAIEITDRWNNAAWTHVSLQMAARRRTFHARQQSLKRVIAAAGELEHRLSALDTRDARLVEYQRQITAHLAGLRLDALTAIGQPAAARPDTSGLLVDETDAFAADDLSAFPDHLVAADTADDAAATTTVDDTVRQAADVDIVA